MKEEPAAGEDEAAEGEGDDEADEKNNEGVEAVKDEEDQE